MGAGAGDGGRRVLAARDRGASRINRRTVRRLIEAVALVELDEAYAEWRDRVALPRRHATGRHIVASNRGFEAWGEILCDAMVAAALIDRLIHHAHMVSLKGKSYRPPVASALRPDD